MYAARRLYVKKWDHQPADERYSVKIARGGKPVVGIQDDRISAIEEEVMYWRKANHIHAWLVDNVQDGEDDCKDYYVDWNQLKELLRICKKVLKASKLIDGVVHKSTPLEPNSPVSVELGETGKVIKDSTVAKELLPRGVGFFFGSDDYDEDYLTDVKDTHDWIVRMLADHVAGVPGGIYYSSSW